MTADDLPAPRLEVDLGAVRRNLAAVAREREASVLAVVKADAYGHGAATVARSLEPLGECWGFAVARLEEGRELRTAGISKPILVFNALPAATGTAEAEDLGEYLLAVGSLDDLRALGRDRDGRPPLAVHLEVDTGMNRCGVRVEEVERALELARSLPAIRLEGMFSHFAESEIAASPVSAQQVERWRAVVARARERGFDGVTHLENTAAAADPRAATRRPPDAPRPPAGARETPPPLVRLGGGLYGMDLGAPSSGGGGGAGRTALEPAARLVSRVGLLRRVPRGEGVGYNHRWRAGRDSLVAIVPAGYADGIAARAGGAGGEALVRGRRAPVIGAVSMDLLALDVTEVGDDALGGRGSALAPGEEVVLLGAQGDERITVGEVAGWWGAVPYEVTCRISARVPRVFRGAARRR